MHISLCPLLKPCIPPGPCLLLCFIFFLPLSYQGLLSCFHFPSMSVFLGVLSLDLFHLKHSPWAVLPTIVLMTPISMFLTKFSLTCVFTCVRVCKHAIGMALKMSHIQDSFLLVRAAPPPFFPVWEPLIQSPNFGGIIDSSLSFLHSSK